VSAPIDKECEKHNLRKPTESSSEDVLRKKSFGMSGMAIASAVSGRFGTPLGSGSPTGTLSCFGAKGLAEGHRRATASPHSAVSAC